MVWENPQRVEKVIRRLTRELEEIDRFIYGQDKESDRVLYAGSLERKRDDVVRSAVLQVHTAIEDLMTDAILSHITGAGHRKAHKKMRSKRGEALACMLTGPGSLGFDMKLNFAVVVGVMSPKARAKLKELNTLRNKCSHNWLLNVAIRKGKKPRQIKPRLLSFRGRDLHKIPVLKEFMAEYGHMYYRMFVKQLSKE